ncbi:Gp49 family protein [Roseateles chitinivorans]|uniref:Gp49 family protein n=1 Tax=Roseateles chitinivorans TaxID=2917965 RepID=UPI003D67A679
MNAQQTEALIKERGADAAPRVTPAQIEAVIASEHYFTAREGVLGMLAADGVPATAYEQANAAPQALGLLTLCVLVLRNGFTVTGESACASPENFDAEIGRRIARANAAAKVWALEGYLLKQMLHVDSI